MHVALMLCQNVDGGPKLRQHIAIVWCILGSSSTK